MTASTSPRRTAAALLALGAIVLTGCSGTPTDSTEPAAETTTTTQEEVTTEETVYTFGDPMPATSMESIRIELPAELIEIHGSSVEDLPILSYTVTPHPLDSTEFCAFDAQVEYAEGGLEFLTSEDPRGAGNKILGNTEWEPIADFTLEGHSRFDRTYLSDDNLTAMIVVKCPASPSELDVGDHPSLAFSGVGKALVTVMRNGTLTAWIESDRYQLDSNGDWI